MQVAEKGHQPRLSLGEDRNMVTKLLSINLTLFAFLLFVKVIYLLGRYHESSFEDVMDWLTLPASPARLLTKPWSLLTSMFTHAAIHSNQWFDWSIVYNMIWLFFFGSTLQHLAGYQRIVPLYLYGGLVAALFYITGMNLIPSLHLLASTSYTLGAAGSVMCLAVAVTTLAPRYRILPTMGGGIPLWVITLLYVVSLLGSNVLEGHDNSLYLTLAGGALTGFVMIRQWERGNDWGAPLNRFLYKLSHLFHPDEENTRDLLVSTGMPFRRVSTKSPTVPEARLNEILDKISMQGIDALTLEEKETLLRASRGE
ncbi:Membrane associated serine protease, rhomboid family [Chitinophaga costaii]|uniref:Membrane associated serine protease, rhomboid family n=1 Tax=Chitinophaga costaii TaxID=1335309 RepID=A0A1C4AB71_9BACT|nr:rhomboid family intramembrane serine protease [Chitinophaga costaii]PUZ26536.1 rhomboid family intramembrane serine protease [Chitinophaga costaii]SCB91855.1 Membrane associated serine protease, rhomboid family [Chitinophaga costaii]